MRTPLNGILGIAALLQRTELADRQRELGSVSTTSGKVLLRLIDDILDLSKMDADSFDVVEERFDMAELIAECVGLIEPSAADKGLTVRQIGPVTDLPALIGDVVRIKQMLFNLLTNAIKFTETGHITLAVDAEPDPGGIVVRISVADTGVGIAQDQLDQIFNRFYQIDGTATRKHGGAGLGLAILAEIVERYDGTLRLGRSTLGGLSVQVHLPGIDQRDP